MAYQRKKRAQEQNAPQTTPQGQSSLFASADHETANEEETVRDRDHTSSPTLENQLQRASQSSFDFGNIPLFAPDQAVPIQRRPQRPTLQARLTVGPVGDKYEQEADQVAAQVVDTINQPQKNTPIQRQETYASASDFHPPNLDIRRMDAEEETDMQRQVEGESIGTQGGAVSPQIASQIQTAKGGGQPLDQGLQRSMGQAMGTNFSNVKVHTDRNAHQLNQTLQAKAFTTGQDVFFRQGEYQPGHRSGQELIAHELTHTVQQGATAQRAIVHRQTDGVIQRQITNSHGKAFSQAEAVDWLATHLNDQGISVTKTQIAAKITPYITKGKHTLGAVLGDLRLQFGGSQSDTAPQSSITDQNSDSAQSSSSPNQESGSPKQEQKQASDLSPDNVTVNSVDDNTNKDDAQIEHPNESSNEQADIKAANSMVTMIEEPENTSICFRVKMYAARIRSIVRDFYSAIKDHHPNFEYNNITKLSSFLKPIAKGENELSKIYRDNNVSLGDYHDDFDKLFLDRYRPNFKTLVDELVTSAKNQELPIGDMVTPDLSGIDPFFSLIMKPKLVYGPLKHWALRSIEDLIESIDGTIEKIQEAVKKKEIDKLEAIDADNELEPMVNDSDHLTPLFDKLEIEIIPILKNEDLKPKAQRESYADILEPIRAKVQGLFDWMIEVFESANIDLETYWPQVERPDVWTSAGFLRELEKRRSDSPKIPENIVDALAGMEQNGGGACNLAASMANIFMSGNKTLRRQLESCFLGEDENGILSYRFYGQNSAISSLKGKGFDKDHNENIDKILALSNRIYTVKRMGDKLRLLVSSQGDRNRVSEKRLCFGLMHDSSIFP